MSKCSDADKVTGCFIPDDGSPKESVLIHTTYNADGDPHKTYATSLDSDTIIDPSTYLGGGVLLIGDCPCVTPAQFKCLKKRDFRLFYDNGATPGSSDNDCESRLNFVRFSWNFEVIGWKTNVGTLGSGFPIPATSGWTPQLQGWVNFGQAVYPVAAPTIEHSFSFTPAPTWRAWVIEGCDPEAQFGTWTLRRDDGCIFNVYPRGYQEQITHIWCVDSLDCDGNPTQTFYNRSQDSDTNVVTWEQIETPENIDCFVDCNRELPPVILPGSESECTEKQYNLCDSSVDPQVELIVFVQECPGQDPIAFAHTLEDWNANLASSEPSPEVPEYDLSTATLVNCDTGESFELPTTECEDKLTTPFCVESQEWTYGLDNTGTTFGDTASYVLTLSDGSTLMWDQSPMSGWSEQLTHWAEEIQTAANNAGLVWFVESRFIDSFNPPNIDGTIDGPGGVASGLPGAPSQNVAVALDAGGMVWRYVNFQICPGQPVPVSAIRVESNVYGNDPYDLTTAGPVLGPVQKFEVCSTCSSCNDDQVGMNWFIYDDSTESGLREATDGEIPNCWEPCGVLSSLPPPPSSDCTFEFDTGCDNNNSDQQADYTNLVTRRVTYCSGKQVGIDFYVPDPDDISALDDYILVGEYVDCATGERIELPPPPCENSSHAGTMWRIRGDAVQEVTVDWWSPVSFPGGQTSAPHDDVTNIFTVSSDGSTLIHSQGAPSVTWTQATGDVRTSVDEFLANVGATDNSQTSGNDQLRVRGYVILESAALLKDTNPNTGERGGIWINQCCAGDLELFFEDTTDSVVGDTGIFDGVRIPAGIHYFEAVTSDLSFWQGFELSFSIDDGATYNPLPIYSTKPSYECIPLILCTDTNTLINAIDGSVIIPRQGDLFCEPPVCPQSAPVPVTDTNAIELCDGSTGFKVEIACCPSVVPTRFGRTYNSDDNVLGSGGIHTVSGYDDIISTLGCTPGSTRKIWFQGAIYVDGKAYNYATQGLTIPASENQAKTNLIAAINQAASGTGVSLRLFPNGSIETRGSDVDIAWTVQKGLLDDQNDICWDGTYFVYRYDLDGTFEGDSIGSIVSNPYDPLAMVQYQPGTTGII